MISGNRFRVLKFALNSAILIVKWKQFFIAMSHVNNGTYYSIILCVSDHTGHTVLLIWYNIEKLARKGGNAGMTGETSINGKEKTNSIGYENLTGTERKNLKRNSAAKRNRKVNGTTDNLTRKHQKKMMLLLVPPVASGTVTAHVRAGNSAKSLTFGITMHVKG